MMMRARDPIRFFFATLPRRHLSIGTLCAACSSGPSMDTVLTENGFDASITDILKGYVSV